MSLFNGILFWYGLLQMWVIKRNLLFGKFKRGGATPSPIGNHDYQLEKALHLPSQIDQIKG